MLEVLRECETKIVEGWKGYVEALAFDAVVRARKRREFVVKHKAFEEEAVSQAARLREEFERVYRGKFEDREAKFASYCDVTGYRVNGTLQDQVCSQPL